MRTSVGAVCSLAQKQHPHPHLRPHLLLHLRGRREAPAIPCSEVATWGCLTTTTILVVARAVVLLPRVCSTDRLTLQPSNHQHNKSTSIAHAALLIPYQRAPVFG
mmetsp:Transcript_20669/g.66332  ORF Transcript_20669/g.66332 Transcript_20669/m.66332 type:complete len:105 (-) Transcript_20669:36-350(-)